MDIHGGSVGKQGTEDRDLDLDHRAEAEATNALVRLEAPVRQAEQRIECPNAKAAPTARVRSMKPHRPARTVGVERATKVEQHRTARTPRDHATRIDKEPRAGHHITVSYL